jgi:hypothetical protein
VWHVCRTVVSLRTVTRVPTGRVATDSDTCAGRSFINGLWHVCLLVEFPPTVTRVPTGRVATDCDTCPDRSCRHRLWHVCRPVVSLPTVARADLATYVVRDCITGSSKALIMSPILSELLLLLSSSS